VHGGFSGGVKSNGEGVFGKVGGKSFRVFTEGESADIIKGQAQEKVL